MFDNIGHFKLELPGDKAEITTGDVGLSLCSFILVRTEPQTAETWLTVEASKPFYIHQLRLQI